MAGEWIKVELATPDKPEVLRMARILGIDKDAVFGKLVRLWAWFDKNSVDGVVDGVVDSDVDQICHQVGFSSALVAVGWLFVDNDNERVSIPKFDRHNGESAKRRALKSEAQAKWRMNRSAVVDSDESTDQSIDASTREEKRREVNNKAKSATPDGFAEFWIAYPKKVGKGAAEEAWKKRKPNLAAVLAALTVAKQSDQWRKDNGQFIPNPATWLNQRRWEDGQEAAQPASDPNEIVTLPDGQKLPRHVVEFQRRMMQ